MASPLEIEIALHYHCRSDEFPRLDAPACKTAVETMVDAGLLIETPQGTRKYQGTEGLAMYVRELGNVNWPRRIWVI